MPIGCKRMTGMPSLAVASKSITGWYAASTPSNVYAFAFESKHTFGCVVGNLILPGMIRQDDTHRGSIMNHMKIIQRIKAAQYETFKSVMRDSRPKRKVSARVGLNKSMLKEFKARMEELNQPCYFWTESHADWSDNVLANDLETNGFQVYVNFPWYPKGDRREAQMHMHAQQLVHDLEDAGLTAVWHSNQGRAIEVIIGLDNKATSVLSIQVAEFDELFA